MFALVATPLSAQLAIEGITVTPSSEWNAYPDQGSAGLTVDNSGLVDGEGNPVSFDVTALHLPDDSGENQWHTDTGDPTPTITFDLGDAFDLEDVHIWNMNQTNLTDRGVQEFDLLVSTDGVDFTPALSSQTLSESPGGTNVAAQTFDLTGNNGVTHVRLEVISNHGSDYTGLAEVMFTVSTPDPFLSAPSELDFGTISALNTEQADIPISNLGATQTLHIDEAALAGFDTDFFTVDSFPATLDPGEDGSIAVTFDPDEFDGDFAASLEVTSDSGGTAGTLSTINLAATALLDPLIQTPPSVAYPFTLPGDTRQIVIPVQNLGQNQALNITDISVTGPDAAKFTIDSSPTSVDPDGEETIAVTFDPGGEEGGGLEATIEITSDSGGVPSTLTFVDLSAGTSLIAFPSDFTITAAAPALSDDFAAGNLFDGDRGTDYASAGGGAGDPFSQDNGTWVELDFGAPVTLDRFILVSRNNDDDFVGESRLIFSDDPTFDDTDTIHTIASTGQRGSAPIHEFPATTARYIRWEVATSTGAGADLGGIEMRFLGTPDGWFGAPGSVIDGTPAFNDDYALANAANGNAGVTTAGGTPGLEYASAGSGETMFVDFDFGSSIPLVALDFFDRMGFPDRTTAFDLLLSDDPTFASGVTSVPIAPGAADWGLRRSFPETTARYARIQATTASGANTGMAEAIFYTTAEPPDSTPYEQYIADTWGLAGTDAAPDLDLDGDGLPNAIEFVLGGDPTTPDVGIAPVQSVNESSLTFTYRQSADAADDDPVVEYGSDLVGWTTASDGDDGVSITVSPDEFGPGVDRVSVAIPRPLASDGRLFVRLAVNVAHTL